MPDWTRSALTWLLEARQREAWPYRGDATPATEPTALAGLALEAWVVPGGQVAPGGQAAPGGPAAPGGQAARQAATWLARIQQSDGSLGPSPRLPRPSWPTTHAILLWCALDVERPARERAVTFLLKVKGNTPARSADSPVGHDTSIVGWPWVEGTHSWVEPTALAILALCRAGRAAHPRVVEGVRLLRDRALSTGGWHVGNTRVFGREMRAHPGPTGLALLALAAAAPSRPDASRGAAPAPAGRPGPEVSRGLAYLEGALPRIRAPQSLGLGLLGLAAWGRTPARAGAWLGESLATCAEAPDRAALASYLLLAASPRTLGMLGIAAPGDHRG